MKYSLNFEQWIYIHEMYDDATNTTEKNRVKIIQRKLKTDYHLQYVEDPFDNQDWGNIVGEEERITWFLLVIS